MRRIIIILTALALYSSCASASMTTRREEPLPAPVSTDPYRGQGTRSEYSILARKYEARYYSLSAKAAKYMDSARQLKFKSFGATYADRMNYRSRYLTMMAKAETYREKARMAAAEYRRYSRLGGKASH